MSQIDPLDHLGSVWLHLEPGQILFFATRYKKMALVTNLLLPSFTGVGQHQTKYVLGIQEYHGHFSLTRY